MRRYPRVGKAFDLDDLVVCRGCGAVVHPTYTEAHDAHHQAIDDHAAAIDAHAAAADAESVRLGDAIERLARR